MTEKFNFSIHGVNVIPEHAIYLNGEDNGLNLERTGNGSIIRQRAGTSNWFHFAIVSPSRLDGDPSHLRSVFLDLALAGTTTLDIIRIHQAGSRGGNPPSSPSFWGSDNGNPPPAGGLPIVGPITRRWSTAIAGHRDGMRVSGALVISAHIVFGVGGQVTFFSAGADFDEQ